MKRMLRFAILFAMPLWMLQGCNPVLYSNLGQNVPLLKEKGEFAGSLGYAYSLNQSDNATDAEGLSLQGAYAFSDKWAGLMSFYTMNNIGQPLEGDWKSNGTCFELGAGRYGVLKNGKWVWEMYGGIGFYSIHNKQEQHYCNVSIVKPFLQPSFGFTSRYFDMAVTPRVGYLHYGSRDFSRSGEMPMYLVDDYFKENDPKIVFEPGLTLRGGWEQIKFQLQYNWSPFNYHRENFYPVNCYYGSISLFVRFPNRYRQKDLGLEDGVNN